MTNTGLLFLPPSFFMGCYRQVNTVAEIGLALFWISGALSHEPELDPAALLTSWQSFWVQEHSNQISF